MLTIEMVFSPTIEIVGPPGVGKSTIYEEVCKRWKPSDEWICQEKLLAPDAGSMMKRFGYSIKRLLKMKASKSIPVGLGLRYAENNRPFASFCWQLLAERQESSFASTGDCFRAAHFIFLDFCRYQAIIDKQYPKPCIINEGFLQKSFLVSDDKEDMRAQAEQYLARVPLPAGLIYIDAADSHLILQRLKGRSKVIASHRDKSEQALVKDIEAWQYLFRIVLDKLNMLPVKILRLNAHSSIEENVRLVQNFSASLRLAPATQDKSVVLNQ